MFSGKSLIHPRLDAVGLDLAPSLTKLEAGEQLPAADELQHINTSNALEQT
jgi:hypothetical protein